jgi:hypothetical protein
MRLWWLVCLLGCSLLVGTAHAQVQFSIDAVSPDVPAVGEGDSVVSGPPLGPPPITVLAAPVFGLILGEELDAFSNGMDTICPAGNGACFTIISYSVDRAAVGAVPPVTTEVTGNGAAGDIFMFEVTGTGVVLTPPSLWLDATSNGLTIGAGGGGESNIDALTTNRAPALALYFSINPAAVPTASVRWAMPGLSPADILLGPGPIPTVYATAAALGLAPTDDIDGVAIMDAAPVGVLSPADVVYISLAPGSPSLGTIPASPGDILQAAPGAPIVIYPAALMALAGTDNLSALSMVDPPIVNPPVPVIGVIGVALLSAALAAMGARRITRG